MRSPRQRTPRGSLRLQYSIASIEPPVEKSQPKPSGLAFQIPGSYVSFIRHSLESRSSSKVRHRFFGFGSSASARMKTRLHDASLRGCRGCLHAEPLTPTRPRRCERKLAGFQGGLNNASDLHIRFMSDTSAHDRKALVRACCSCERIDLASGAGQSGCTAGPRATGLTTSQDQLGRRVGDSIPPPGATPAQTVAYRVSGPETALTTRRPVPQR